ncbi:7798_t:CDS:2, partial [Paraglomus brasilianum]
VMDLNRDIGEALRKAREMAEPNHGTLPSTIITATTTSLSCQALNPTDKAMTKDAISELGNSIEQTDIKCDNMNDNDINVTNKARKQKLDNSNQKD